MCSHIEGHACEEKELTHLVEHFGQAHLESAPGQIWNKGGDIFGTKPSRRTNSGVI